MQPSMSPGMFERRPLDVEDYLNILRRNKGWLLGPTLAGLVIAIIAAFLWPDTYLSIASIRVVPPQVPESFVQTNVTVQMADRVNAMQQTILSRNTLTNIIQTYDLYRKDRNRIPFEDIIEDMRKDIKISGLQRVAGATQMGTSAFQIGFSYENRYVAQKVTRDLMTRFIDENIRERSSQSQMTTQFMREQYGQAKTVLDEIEQRLTTFRMANIGRLPEQMGNNVQQMTGLETRVSALNANISRANQEKLMLESELRGLREKLASAKRLAVPDPVTGSVASANGEDELTRVEREIVQLERVLERMLEQYKPTYPDVQRIQARLLAAKKERDVALNRRLTVKESAATPAAPAPPQRINPMMVREIVELETQVNRIQSSIRAKDLEVDRYIQDIGDADRKLKSVQQKIEVGPIGAHQLEQLTRDHELAKRKYDELQAKVSRSEVATDLENRKQGETLEVLDLPSLPESPTDPNRPLIIGIGAFIGIMLGAGLVIGRELKDTSLKTLKDVRSYTQFNVLGSVPLLENDLVVRRRRRLATLAWATALILSVFVSSGSIWYYYNTKL
ncbi:MAG: hypothetical protein JJE04_22660 [Acidobacteriia bacterium]|nr:hypothetical protein [Terriglobia bacterium]